MHMAVKITVHVAGKMAVHVVGKMAIHVAGKMAVHVAGKVAVHVTKKMAYGYWWCWSLGEMKGYVHGLSSDQPSPGWHQIPQRYPAMKCWDLAGD